MALKDSSSRFGAPALDFDLCTDFGISPVDFDEDWWIERQGLLWKLNQSGSHYDLVTDLLEGKSVKEALAALGVDSVEVLRRTTLEKTELVTRGTRLIGTLNYGYSLNVRNLDDIAKLDVGYSSVNIYSDPSSESHSSGRGAFALAFNGEV